MTDYTLLDDFPLAAIPLAKDADPRATIEAIAQQLVKDGETAADRRQGRRLLGAIQALWAEDGADLDDPEPTVVMATLAEVCTVIQAFRHCCASLEGTNHLIYCPETNIEQVGIDALREVAHDMRQMTKPRGDK